MWICGGPYGALCVLHGKVIESKHESSTMKKITATFFIVYSVACIVACGGSKQSTGSVKANTSTIMDSGAQSTPHTLPDSTKH